MASGQVARAGGLAIDGVGKRSGSRLASRRRNQNASTANATPAVAIIGR